MREAPAIQTEPSLSKGSSPSFLLVSYARKKDLELYFTCGAGLRIVTSDDGVFLLNKTQVRLNDHTFRVNGGGIQSWSPNVKLHGWHF